MTTKRNVVLYLDKDLIEKSKALGFNLSKIFENHLKQVITQFSNSQNTQNFSPSENRRFMVGLPGFEPESIEPKSTSLDQASRQPRVSQPQKVASLFKNFVLSNAKLKQKGAKVA